MISKNRDIRGKPLLHRRCCLLNVEEIIKLQGKSLFRILNVLDSGKNYQGTLISLSEKFLGIRIFKEF